jgi:hypothetical protein
MGVNEPPGLRAIMEDPDLYVAESVTSRQNPSEVRPETTIARMSRASSMTIELGTTRSFTIFGDEGSGPANAGEYASAVRRRVAAGQRNFITTPSITEIEQIFRIAATSQRLLSPL